MKILFLPAHYIFDEYRFGSELANSYNIVDRILKINDDRSIVVTGRKYLLTNKKYRVVEVQQNKPNLDMSFINAIIFSIRYTIAGIYLLKKERFDLIHHVRPFTLGKTFNIFFILNFLHKTPCVIGSFCSPYKNAQSLYYSKKRLIDYFYLFIDFTISPLLKLLSNLTLKKASKVIVYDKLTAELILNYVDKEKIAVIPPGKDKKLYKYNIIKFYDENIVILAIGHLIDRKGFDVVIRSLPLIIEKHKNVKLRIIGDGIEKKRIKSLAESLKIIKFVDFVGTVENRFIHTYYQSAHIFVHMAREETYGQVYIEALASGLPIISADNVAASQILKQGRVGIIIPQEDFIRLSAEVNFLIENREIMKKMSAQARVLFESKYDWDTVIIPKYLEVYKSVVNK